MKRQNGGARMEVEREKLLAQKVLFSDEDFKIEVIDQSPASERRALHEAIEIKYFYGDRSALMINSEMFIARAGDIAIVNPYEIHTTVAIDKYSGRYYLIMMDPDFLGKVMPRGLDLRQFFLVKRKKIQNLIRGDQRLEAIILRLIEETEKQQLHYRLVVQNLVSEFFVLLLRGYVNEEASEKIEDDRVKYVELIAPALSRMHTDYTKKLTVEDLATLCNVTKYHFCRVFKRAMGVTAVQYLTSYRIDLAEAMLGDTTRSIREVAFACGFEDESYFYRCYKKYKGASPKAAREKK
ncbi:MAG: AraC family transcriptional regulator [Clostridia bacterium]|nr:AraC family transcriptional regulator [Clostridia bacterium]